MRREKLKVEKPMVGQCAQPGSDLGFQRVVRDCARYAKGSVIGSLDLNGLCGVSAQAIELIEYGDLQFCQQRRGVLCNRHIGWMSLERMKLARACVRCGIERRIGDRGAGLALIAGLHKMKLMNIVPCANMQGHPDGLEPASEYQR